MTWQSSNSCALGSPEQSPEVLVERLFRRIGEISSLPVVAVRIIDVAND